MFKRLLSSFTILLVLGLIILNYPTAKAMDYPSLSGELYSGARITFSEPGDGFAWIKLTPTVKDWNGSSALAVRVKNNTGIDSPLQFSLHETSSEIFATDQGDEMGPDKTVFISQNGTVVEKAVKWGNIWIPANFDGTMIIPFESFNDIDPNTGDNTLDLASIYALFVGVNIQYNAFEDLTFGEFAVIKDNATTSVLDIIALNEADFTNAIVKDLDVNSQKAIIGRIPEPVYPSLTGNLYNGARVSFSEPGDGFAWMKINPAVTDWNGGIALAFRIKNETAIDSPIQFSLHETSAEIFVTDQGDEFGPDKTYFINLDGTVVEKSVKWGNIWIPANFNGTMIIPFNSFNDIDPSTGDNTLDLANIYALFLGVNIQYNSFEKLTLGEIAVVKENSTLSVLDFTSLNETDFTNALVKDPDANSQRTVIERAESGLAIRMGDVKIIEAFPYITDNALHSAITTWEGGSEINLSKYDDASHSESAMRVDIGAPIPGNNPYASINIFPQANVIDWTAWNNGETYAKGITFWVKNLSDKEITINLEFDEYTAGNYGSNNEDFTHERHNIKYGARIMLMDKDGNEFIVHAKPTFAIPVGFEGWVRISFSQYWIPEWCTWGDGNLDLTKPIDGIFLTSDTTKNEGLSFVIDSIGVYFNDTEISSLFNQPTNSFKNNMDLE